MMMQPRQPGKPDPVRIAVISDIHGNARAFRAALQLARQRGFDQLVLLGDLLTYGCDPIDVLALAAEAVEEDGAVLLEGNHDRLYADLERGELGYYRSLPDWLREAVDWTMQALGGRSPHTGFSWLAEFQAAGIFFSHANPFGDWTYLNRASDFRRAAGILDESGWSIGVFGHTHRAKVVEIDCDGEIAVAEALLGPLRLCDRETQARRSTYIIDPGSVGQPRGGPGVSTILFLSSRPNGMEVEHVAVPYDVSAHKRDIRGATLSAATRDKLAGFFP